MAESAQTAKVQEHQDEYEAEGLVEQQQEVEWRLEYVEEFVKKQK